LKKIKYVTKF